MKIFITNDDGIQARGIKQLITVAKEFGEVFVLAPDRAQSGQSHAITLSTPLRANRLGIVDGVPQVSCSGTPVDCVKIGLKEIYKEHQFDLLLSGINHGSNAATNVIYSGTMGAAIEGCMEHIPSIGFSTVSYDPQIDFEPVLPSMRHLIRAMINHGNRHSCWNVNMPTGEVKGIKFCAQSKANWQERVARREDPNGRPYFWIEGDLVDDDPREYTDLHYISEGYVAAVPVMVDMTDMSEMERLNFII